MLQVHLPQHPKHTINILLDSLMGAETNVLSVLQSHGESGRIQREVGRHRWLLLVRFLLCSRTLVYFVMLICLTSVDPGPSSDALWGGLMRQSEGAKYTKATTFWSDFQTIIIRQSEKVFILNTTDKWNT